VEISPSSGGTVEVDGSAPCSFPYNFSVIIGKDVELEAIPEDGYHFAYWIEDDELLSSENPIEVEVLFYPRSLIAYFMADGREFTSNDKMISVIIPQGTNILDEAGNPITGLEFIVDETPPPPPPGADIVGSPYELGPDGVTFDQPVTLTWIYDPASIPTGVAEEDLFLAYYDEGTDEWVELSSVVDPTNDTITTSIEHFTTFAIIASIPTVPANFSLSSLEISPTQTNVNRTVNISVLVSNTGEEEGSHTVNLKINDVIEETREVTLGGGTSETITFTTTRDEAGTYSVDIDGLIASFTVKETTVNWLILGPIIAGVTVLITFLAIKLRNRNSLYSYWKA